MPNYVFNTLEILGSDREFQSLLDTVKSDESAFDFNKIIPMPDELMGISHGSCLDENGNRLNNWIVSTDKQGNRINLPVDEEALIKKYGACNWYSWACDNWDTKWNASDVEIDGCIKFTTAWSPPINVIKKLSDMFPELRINLLWEEEQGFGELIQFYRGGYSRTHDWDSKGHEYKDYWITEYVGHPEHDGMFMIQDLEESFDSLKEAQEFIDTH